MADVTYGKGVFWRQVDLSKYQLFPSDILTGIDFRDLPYEDESLDMVVLDPPYKHSVRGKTGIDERYNTASVDLRHSGVIQLYGSGMAEAFRVLKYDGHLVVKCQDQVESGANCWDHDEIKDMAVNLGLFPEDLFILVNPNPPLMRHDFQEHARKNHSFFWVFTKKKTRKRWSKSTNPLKQDS